MYSIYIFSIITYSFIEINEKETHTQNFCPIFCSSGGTAFSLSLVGYVEYCKMHKYIGVVSSTSLWFFAMSISWFSVHKNSSQFKEIETVLSSLAIKWIQQKNSDRKSIKIDSVDWRKSAFLILFLFSIGSRAACSWLFILRSTILMDGRNIQPTHMRHTYDLYFSLGNTDSVEVDWIV